MSSAVATRGSLVVSEELKQQATSSMMELADERVATLTVTTATGHTVELGAAVSELVFHILERVAQGGAIGVHTAPEVLTTSAAAGLLGVSRTTVMNLIRSGELPAQKAGTHHRVLHADVVALREKREARRNIAIGELLDLQDP